MSFELINNNFLIYENSDDIDNSKRRINIVILKYLHINKIILIPFDKPGTIN